MDDSGVAVGAGPVAATAQRLRRLAGWRRRGAAFAAGAVLTLALPPVYAFPALYLAFPVLIWMLAGAGDRRAAFGLGWWFGFGYFVVGLYWIGNALLTFAELHAWFLPLVTFGLPAFLALFTGLATLIARFGQNDVQRVLLLTAGWSGAEWLRGHVLTGFPWNLTGHAWVGSDALLQSASVVGIYGVGLMAVLSACTLALVAGAAKRRRWAAVFAAAAIPLVAWTGGALRLGAAAPVGEAAVDGVGLRIVQANIPQREKWRRQFQRRNLELHLRLSILDRPSWVTHVIWPETAATFFLEESETARRRIAEVIPAGGTLITGAPRRREKPFRIWNSVVALDGDGAVVATYDKSHLVPFGEYVPFGRYLPFVNIAGGGIGYSPGVGPRTLRLGNLPPVSLLICFEAIFPGAVLDPDDRPSWLLNLTNDAWYGSTAGPHQHLAITRVRAAEEGLPFVRAAYTGISAVVDSYGRVVAKLGLGRRGVLDVRLPAEGAGPTPYSRHGDAAFLALIAVLLATSVYLAGRDRRRDRTYRTALIP